MERCIKRGMAIFLCVLMWSAAAYATPVDVVRNGNFAGGMMEWNLDPAIPASWNPLDNGMLSLHPPSGSFQGYKGMVVYQSLNVTTIRNVAFTLAFSLTKGGAPAGNTIAAYLDYVNDSGQLVRVKVANPDNGTITTATPVTASYTFPADAAKLVRLHFDKEGDGLFSVGAITITASGVTTGPVPAVTSLSATTIPYGSTVTINGTGFGGAPPPQPPAGSSGTTAAGPAGGGFAGVVTVAGSAAGVTVNSWSDTAITVTLQQPVRSGRVVVVSDAVESNNTLFCDIGSPNFTLDVLNGSATAVRGTTAEFVARVDFLNGFSSSGGVTFSVDLPAGSWSFTPVPLTRSGGLVLRINTAALAPGIYHASIQASEAGSATRTAPVSLKVVTVADIQFYEWGFSETLGSYKQLLTGKTVTQQGEFSGVQAEAFDTDGKPVGAPIELSSSNPGLLGVYTVYSYGPLFYALDNTPPGSPVNLVATTPDGFSRSLPITIAMPPSPKVDSLFMQPMTITNAQTGVDNLIEVNATFAGAVDQFSWGVSGAASFLVSFVDGEFNPENNSFQGKFYLNADLADPQNPVPANPGMLAVRVSSHICNPSCSASASRALPLIIANDAAYSAARVGVRPLDASMTHGFTLQFHTPDGTKVFERSLFSDPMAGASVLNTVGGIIPGTYKVRYVAFDGLSSQWYPNAADSASAQAVTFTAGQSPDLYFFPRASFEITVVRNGSGSGSVAGTGGISCGATCSGNYPAGSLVILTAMPGEGSVFSGWSGGCFGTGVCAVLADSAHIVTATFTAAGFTLKTTLDGTGGGSVQSNGNFSCAPEALPAFCTHGPYPAESQFTLYAVPDTYSIFINWSGGGCSGSGDCPVTLQGNTEVVATFQSKPPVFISANPPLYFSSLQAGCTAAPGGSTVLLKLHQFNENVVLSRDVAIVLAGGYDGAYQARPGFSSLQGSLTLASGSVIIERLAIL